MLQIKNNKQFWTLENLNFDIVSNFVLRISNFNKGFTLIELLIVVTMIGLIGTLTTQIFILGIRSQGKSEILKDVKQNGDFALTVMENMVRNAVDIESECNASHDEITILNPDGLETKFKCDLNGNKISSESAYFAGSVTYDLTSTKVAVEGCTFRVVCPTPPLSPKYVFVNFTIRDAKASAVPTPGEISSLDYQTTVSLRSYQ